MTNEEYEQILFSPIRRSATLKQARARARWARIKLARHEKATRMPVGDAAKVFDLIEDAEAETVEKLVRSAAQKQLAPSIYNK